jgi:hypothetical protein
MEQPTKANIPIPELPFNEEVWLIVSVMSVREGLTKQGKPFRELRACNSTGSLAVKIWAPALEGVVWAIKGMLEAYQDQPQFVVSKYSRMTIEKYREHQKAEPVLPRAFTIDIETLALPGFRERVRPKLEETLRRGDMRLEQQQRYREDSAAEEERFYQLGSLHATSGRILSIAVHVGAIPHFKVLRQRSKSRQRKSRR